MLGDVAFVTMGNKAFEYQYSVHVWRPDVEESAPLQQASGRLHDEVWVGRVRFLRQVNSKEVEIQPGCAVMVSRLLAPFFAPESPGTGREVWSWVDTTGENIWV